MGKRNRRHAVIAAGCVVAVSMFSGATAIVGASTPNYRTIEVQSADGGPAAPGAAETDFGVHETLADAITFIDAEANPLNSIVWSSALSGDTVHLTAQLPEITVPVELRGEDVGRGPAQLTIDGGGSAEHLGSIFRVAAGIPGLSVQFYDLTLRNGYTTGNGAAIDALSPILVNGVFSGNVAAGPASRGGAVYAPGLAAEGMFEGNRATVAGGAVYASKNARVDLRYSQIAGNHSADGGGLAIDHAAQLYVSDSTVSGNTARRNSGGIDVRGAATVRGGVNNFVIRNSTIAKNRAVHNAGGIGVDGHAVLLQQDTIADNHAASGGGIVFSPRLGGSKPNGSLTLEDTIDAANLADSHPDLLLQAGGRASARFSLVGDADRTGIKRSGENIVGTSRHRAHPKLGPLKANGSAETPHRLETMLPLPGSPALDAGRKYASAPDDERGHFRTISLGLQRPKGGDGTDVGAVELRLADLPQRTVTKRVGNQRLKLSLPPNWVCVAPLNHYGPPTYGTAPASYPLRLDSTPVPGSSGEQLTFTSARFSLSGKTKTKAEIATALPASVSVRYKGLKRGIHHASAAVMFSSSSGMVRSTISATFKVC